MSIHVIGLTIIPYYYNNITIYHIVRHHAVFIILSVQQNDKKEKLTCSYKFLRKPFDILQCLIYYI